MTSPAAVRKRSASGPLVARTAATSVPFSGAVTVNESHRSAKRGSPTANLQSESDVIVPLIGSPIRMT